MQAFYINKMLLRQKWFVWELFTDSFFKEPKMVLYTASLQKKRKNTFETFILLMGMDQLPRLEVCVYTDVAFKTKPAWEISIH